MSIQQENEQPIAQANEQDALVIPSELVISRKEEIWEAPSFVETILISLSMVPDKHLLANMVTGEITSPCDWFCGGSDFTGHSISYHVHTHSHISRLCHHEPVGSSGNCTRCSDMGSRTEP